MIDIETYFGSVRDSLFGGSMTQQQVDGQCVIVGLWNYQATGTPMTDIRWLAYMLATVYHECATRMWPVTEYGTQEYLESREYWPFVGRGFVQLTWQENYDRASAILGLIDDRDLVAHPDLALDSLIAARVMFRGMAEGWFTSAKLGNYFNEEDDNPIEARAIINSDVSKNGPMIADYHYLFLDALQDASSPTANGRIS